MPGSEPIQSVVKATDIVKLVGRSDHGLRLRDVAAELGLKTPSTHHLVRTLVGCGFLKRREGLLVLGDELLGLVRSEHDTAFQAAAAIEMQRLFTALPRCIVVLAEATQYTLELTQRISYDRPHVLQRVHGQHFHIYANAVGLLALAVGAAELREHLQQRHPFAEHGQGLWQTRERLRDFLMQAQAKGHAECPFDQDLSFRAAAPVTGEDGRFVGALGISITASQLPDQAQRDAAVAELRRSTELLSGQF